jgi:anti-sigma regulatory factor (Ser/Thr protein kinase)
MVAHMSPGIQLDSPHLHPLTKIVGSKHTIRLKLQHLDDLQPFRNAFEAYVDQLDMENSCVIDSMLIVGELSANAVRHGGGGYVDLTFDQGILSILFCDYGKGIPVEELEKVLQGIRPPGLSENHWGYYIIRECLQNIRGKMEVRTDLAGTLVCVTIPVSFTSSIAA